MYSGYLSVCTSQYETSNLSDLRKQNVDINHTVKNPHLLLPSQSIIPFFILSHLASTRLQPPSQAPQKQKQKLRKSTKNPNSQIKRWKKVQKFTGAAGSRTLDFIEIYQMYLWRYLTMQTRHSTTELQPLVVVILIQDYLDTYYYVRDGLQWQRHSRSQSWYYRSTVEVGGYSC